MAWTPGEIDLTTTRVSVVIPCRNEERFIADCLDSVLANDFPHDRLEILVVDGESGDRTAAIVTTYAARYAFVRLLRNPGRTAPRAVNIGVREARGDVIMRLDAHSTYAPDYIGNCVRGLAEHRADNVGGVWVIEPRETTAVARAIGVALGHRFGIGNAQYRLRPSAPMEVDTVPFGCYRRDVFDRVGPFNEDLRRGQDMEFNLRLRAAGGRIVLLPDVVCHYHPRATLGAFSRHNFWNGIWVFYPMRFGRIAFSARHLVPGLFVATLVGSGALGAVWYPAWALTAAAAGSYVVASVASSLTAAWRGRDWALALTLPLVFASLHGGYGLGTLVGLLRVVITPGFWRALGRRG